MVGCDGLEGVGLGGGGGFVEMVFVVVVVVVVVVGGLEVDDGVYWFW